MGVAAREILETSLRVRGLSPGASPPPARAVSRNRAQVRGEELHHARASSTRAPFRRACQDERPSDAGCATTQIRPAPDSTTPTSRSCTRMRAPTTRASAMGSRPQRHDDALAAPVRQRSSSSSSSCHDRGRDRVYVVTDQGAATTSPPIQTRAVRSRDDYWLIENGSKIYITNAATADWLCLLGVDRSSTGASSFSRIIVPTRSRLPLRPARQIRQLGSDTGRSSSRHCACRSRTRSADAARLPAADDTVPGRRPSSAASAASRARRTTRTTGGSDRAARTLRRAALEDAVQRTVQFVEM